MTKLKLFMMACFMLSMASVVTSCSDDDDSSDDHQPVKIEKTTNTALLLCSFGSTYEQPQATYDAVVADFKKAFPDVDVYLSFTSRTILSRVYAQLGKAYAQPDVWLSAFADAGYEKVYVQSLHIIPGEEYVSLINTDVKKNFMIPNPTIKVAKGACLLDSDKDIEAVAAIIYNYYKDRLNSGEVVALMGHGNPDKEYEHANQKYDDLESELQKLSGEQNIFVGTVDWGDKMFSHVREGIKAFASSKNKDASDIIISLSPLMSIAGDHAQNDLLGDLEPGQTFNQIDPEESDWEAKFSWKLKLEKLGYKINPQGSTTSESAFNVIGLGDHQAIRTIWVNHMKDAIPDAESWNDHLGE